MGTSKWINWRVNEEWNFLTYPKNVRLAFFNVRGELIDIIEHDGPMNDGSASWDLKTK